MRCLLYRSWCLSLRFLVTAWCLLAAAWANAAPGPVLDAAATGASPTPLTAWFELLEDPKGTLTLEQVRSPEYRARFIPSRDSGEALNFGITPSTWWLRLRLANGSSTGVERLLEVAYARLSHLNFYAPEAGGHVRTIETGTTAPFESRGYLNRNFVFPVILPPQTEQTLYLRVASTTAFIVPARLWEPTAFHAYERSDYTVQAWYFGMAAAMVLFNLLLFVRLKDWLYLQYVGFALSMAFALAAQNGLVKEAFRLESALWSDVCTSFGYSFALASGMLFLRRMVETRRLLPRLEPWLQGFIAFFLISPLLFLVTGQALIKAAALTYLLAMVTLMGVAIYAAWRRQRSAYFFLAAFALLGLGAVTNALRAMGQVPSNVFTANAMQFGSALEMILLALALADRFNQMRREKAIMQAELLATQKALIDTLKDNELRLEARVTERTAALETANHRLRALSRTDGLTAIANRRRFDEVLANEWARSQRTGEPLALAMLDIDWFKAYNDHYGHLAGDDCLRTVAGVLANCAVRSTDLVARYGGEEFTIVAPGTTAAQMQALALEVQQALAALALPHPTTPSGCVTLSAGVAAHIAQAGETPESLVAAADQALYQAKATGRNRVVLA
ncbi:sensor domain-containing diguanylate cyclase [Simplicispira suum]|uniref:diguanylate cyclase n=1 Tax=Simplicispira suum TaxID=2109915 RepID=A0A2S0MW47_9BURK|nr:sensor domain-containing diguanylate cyclase [Simplicispira suum]